MLESKLAPESMQRTPETPRTPRDSAAKSTPESKNPPTPESTPESKKKNQREIAA